MSTDIAPSPPSPDATAQANLVLLLSPFSNNPYRFLLALLRDPDRSHADICREIGVLPERVGMWRYSLNGFKVAMEAITSSRADLRSEYARLAFLEATPKVADAMVKRAEGQGQAAQRAGERILETTGVLSASGGSASAVPVRVVTHTYILVESASGPPLADVVVESVTKELLPPKEG